MPRSGIIGTYSLPPNTNNQAPNTPISSSMFNSFASDVQQTFNDPTPVAYGGTGAATVSDAQKNLDLEPGVDIPSNSQLDAVSSRSSMDVRRNLFVNGSFGVSQENGNNLGTTNGYYPADQIALYFTAATAAMSVQRVQVRSLANALDQTEFKTTTAKAVVDANDFVTLTQNIEGSSFAAAGFGTAAAVPLVLRAEVSLPAGTYHFHFANSANNRHCAVPFTVAPGEANTAVVKEIVVPPDTTGTWLTADGVIGITCDLVLAAGSGLTGGAVSTWGSTPYLAASAQKNILDSTANVARLADIGLRLDPDATGVYGQYEVGEVHPVYRSERYWEKSYDYGVAPGAVSFGGVVSGVSDRSGLVRPFATYKHTKCKAASVTVYSPATGASGFMRNNETPADVAVGGLAANGTNGFVPGASFALPGSIAYLQFTANARLS